MKELKSKPRALKAKKSANSPSPEKFAACGHSHCGETCNVRYIGPVSPIRDHHIMHVARGVSHVWTAAIIAGLAVVLTGAVAYSSVNASNQQKEEIRSAQSTGMILDKMQSLENKIKDLERDVQVVSANQQTEAPTINDVFPAQAR